MVLLKAVCDARAAKSKTTATASRMMTCFLLVRFGTRVGVAVLTLGLRRNECRRSTLCGHYRCRTASRQLPAGLYQGESFTLPFSPRALADDVPCEDWTRVMLLLSVDLFPRRPARPTI